VILKDHDILKPGVTPQIDDPGPVSQKDILNGLRRQGGKGLLMERSLDHHFMAPTPFILS
jgi:hypothetical protein